MSRRGVLRADEGGFTLVEVIVGTMIEAVVVSLVATAVFAFAVVNQGFQVQASNSSTSAVAATTWREKVAAATEISVTDSAAATFSGPAAGGTCAEKKIAFVTVGNVRELQLTTTPFTGGVDSTTGACTGTAGAAAVAVLDGDAGAGDQMVFRSLAGRGMAYSGGTLTLDAGAPPVGVSAGAWASTIVGAAELDLTVNASSGHPATVAVSQLATGHTVIPPADAASTWTAS